MDNTDFALDHLYSHGLSSEIKQQFIELGFQFSDKHKEIPGFCQNSYIHFENSTYLEYIEVFNQEAYIQDTGDLAIPFSPGLSLRYQGELKSLVSAPEWSEYQPEYLIRQAPSHFDGTSFWEFLRFKQAPVKGLAFWFTHSHGQAAVPARMTHPNRCYRIAGCVLMPHFFEAQIPRSADISYWEYNDDWPIKDHAAFAMPFIVLQCRDLKQFPIIPGLSHHSHCLLGECVHVQFQSPGVDLLIVGSHS